MKKIIYASVALIALAACNKEKNLNYEGKDCGAALLTVSVSSANRGTRASYQTEDEMMINSLQVLVFNGDNIDGYASSNDSTVTVSATRGLRSMYAVVNGPDLSTVKTKTGFLASETSLTDFFPEGFVMVGSETDTIGSKNTIQICVSRVASRVRIDKVTRAFTVPGLAALGEDKFKIVRYYLSNVVDNSNYEFTTDYCDWLNSTINPSGRISKDSFLYYDFETPKPLAQNASYSVSHSFYAYPNDTDEESAEAKPTKLVVEVQIDGNYYTYPISLGKLLNNRSYEIKELKITRLGNLSDGDEYIENEEDKTIQSASIDFKVDVNDWALVLISSEGQEEGTVVI